MLILNSVKGEAMSFYCHIPKAQHRPRHGEGFQCIVKKGGQGWEGERGKVGRREHGRGGEKKEGKQEEREEERREGRESGRNG